MTATVLPNLKLQPRVFALQDGVISAHVVPEAPEQFVVHARIASGGKGLLEIPVSLSSNVKSFVVSARTNDAIIGTVQMLADGNDKIKLLSNQKTLQPSSIFALGLPGTGNVSANGTVEGTIRIAFAELPEGESQEVRIRMSISQN